MSDCSVVIEHFSKPEIVHEMHDRNQIGLRPWESYIIQTYFLPKNRILDIGCGTGREAFALLKKGFQITGIDLSEPQIAVARDEAESNGYAITFQVTAGLSLEFSNNTFDHIII